jgi:2-isopropylmalate synthase
VPEQYAAAIRHLKQHVRGIDQVVISVHGHEIMRPEEVGITRTDLVLGKHSGRHALRQRTADLGYHLSDEQLQRAFEAFTVHRHAVIGDGPIDAVFKAIEHLTGIDLTLRDYRLRSVRVGEDAQGEAHVEAEYDGRVINGRGVSTDIIEASALAFLQVINRIALRQQQPRLHPQTETVSAT